MKNGGMWRISSRQVKRILYTSSHTYSGSVQLEAATKKRRRGRPSLSSTEPWLERATTIFASLDASASLVTSSSSRSVLHIPPSSMTLRNRNKEKNSVPIPSLEATNDTTKPLIGNTVGDGQKDEASTYSGDQSPDEDGHDRSSSSSSTERDQKTLTRKKLPRVILRLGKPPDRSV